MHEKLLILDLDETLVHATPEGLPWAPSFTVDEYMVHVRPGFDAFIDAAERHFTLAVWTSSSAAYAGPVVDQLFGAARDRLRFVWTRERCVRRFNGDTMEFYWVKDLKKVRRLGYEISSILLVDDSPEKAERNYGNHVHVTPFTGDPADRELELPAIYLADLGTHPNFRGVEKRAWRSTALRLRSEAAT